MAWVPRQDFAAATEKDYRVAIKRFYRWKENLERGEHPEYVDWIKTTEKISNQKLPSDLLDEDDVIQLLETAQNPRDKAIIALLWEAGSRPGEIIDLQVRDIETHKWGRQVVQGKTGARLLPLILSSPHINEWLEEHPVSDDPEAPLWVYVEGQTHGGEESRRGDKASYDTPRRLLYRLFERAELEKKEKNFYLFRHRRATYLANHLTEAQMCQFFGWKQGSNMLSKYVHLAGRDIDEAYGEIYGKTETKRRDRTEPKTCKKCGMENRVEARYCDRCSSPLDTATALKLEEEENEKKKDIIQDLSAEELRQLALDGLEAQN